MFHPRWSSTDPEGMRMFGSCCIYRWYIICRLVGTTRAKRVWVRIWKEAAETNCCKVLSWLSVWKTRTVKVSPRLESQTRSTQLWISPVTLVLPCPVSTGLSETESVPWLIDCSVNYIIRNVLWITCGQLVIKLCGGWWDSPEEMWRVPQKTRTLRKFSSGYNWHGAYNIGHVLSSRLRQRQWNISSADSASVVRLKVEPNSVGAIGLCTWFIVLNSK
jgi:hypothetical protein